MYRSIGPSVIVSHIKILMSGVEMKLSFGIEIIKKRDILLRSARNSFSFIQKAIKKELAFVVLVILSAINVDLIEIGSIGLECADM